MLHINVHAYTIRADADTQIKDRGKKGRREKEGRQRTSVLPALPTPLIVRGQYKVAHINTQIINKKKKGGRIEHENTTRTTLICMCVYIYIYIKGGREGASDRRQHKPVRACVKKERKGREDGEAERLEEAKNTQEKKTRAKPTNH